MQLYDMHCHLDFANNTVELARACEDAGIGMYSCTVTPQGYEATSALLAGAGNVAVGAGMHPWWVAAGDVDDEDIELLCRQIRETRFVGELGLDFGARHGEEQERQVAFLARAFKACTAGGKLLSIHAVKSADLVLDLLEEKGLTDSCDCIFHWFSGSSPELTRAVEAGCFFSVNEMMLATKRGRAYAKSLPADRLLLETDLPEQGVGEYSVVDYSETLNRTADLLCKLRDTDLRPQLFETSHKLLLL